MVASLYIIYRILEATSNISEGEVPYRRAFLWILLGLNLTVVVH